MRTRYLRIRHLKPNLVLLANTRPNASAPQ
jgi:CRP/FNR family transcriptional regulator, cyclic AMP receptor protein